MAFKQPRVPEYRKSEGTVRYHLKPRPVPQVLLHGRLDS